jgi:hypothetical protein
MISQEKAMSDLRGLSKPPRIETGYRTGKIVSAVVVGAIAVGAAGYVYVSAQSARPAHQVVAMNDVHTAALPRALPAVSEPAPAPAPVTTPAPEPAPAAESAPVKAEHFVKTAHTSSHSFVSRPSSSDDSPASDAPAPALKAAPEQPAPQDSQTVPAQNAPAQNPLAPTTPQTTQSPDQSNPQTTDQQNPQTAPQSSPQ